MYEVFDAAIARLLGAYANERDALRYAISYRRLNQGSVEVSVVWRADTGARSVVFTDDQIAGAIQRSAGVIISSNASTAPTTSSGSLESPGTAGIPSSLVPA